VVIGSTTTVPPSVYSTLAATVPTATIARWSATGWPSLSRTVADRVFHTATTAFVVTYKADDDALATASVAGLIGGPLIFVDGTASSVPSATIARLQSLGVDDVYVVGSTWRVSSAIKAQIDALPGVTAHRISGSDAYDMSRKVNTAFASDFVGSAAYLAYGGTSLGGALAAAAAVPDGAPVYLTRSYCVPVSTIGLLVSSGHTDLTLIGSTSELSDAVGVPTAC
jgi:putative cell wall-binding protein